MGMRDFFAISVILGCSTLAPAGDWPAWRGPTGDGVSLDVAVPLTWSATENVAWKVAVPGVGHSSPIVAAGRVYVTSCLPDTRERAVLCFARADGKLLWQKAAIAADIEKMHKNNTPASATPVSDGDRVWATFAAGDTIAVVCFTADGERKWVKGLDGFKSPHGFCGSPILVGDTLIVNGDSDGEAFLAGLDKLTGDIRWKTPRPNKTRSFSVPLLIEVGGKPQMVLAGSKSVAAFDPVNGKQLWVVDSKTDKFVATVAFSDGVVLATGTSPVSTMTGIRPDGSGNVTKTHVLWSGAKGASYVPSPLAVGKNFLVVADDGVATLVAARTGKQVWSERLGRHHDASPILVNGHALCLADDGTTFVLKPGEEFDLVRKNSLGEECHATPAVSDGQLFIRSAQHLWCIGTQGPTKTLK
jgi:outer membrane protein assembly factor BamB